MSREIPVAVVKGGGDLGSGVAYRLWKTGYRVVCTDLPKPMVIRRTVSFSSAIFDGRVTVEGIQAERIASVDEAVYLWSQRVLPVLVDPDARVVDVLKPEVVVDAIMAKRNLGTAITHAPCVIALGPGFEAGTDCHAVIETQRGHTLGRVIWRGAALPNTGIPGALGGEDTKRVIRAPVDGRMYGRRAIGDLVKAGEVIAQIDLTPVHTEIGGVLRGLLHDGLSVKQGLKIADVDPRGDTRTCFTISDKALAIAGGVLEAVGTLRHAT
jgi:xanthine dehydrogenase accessory factor